MFNAIVFTPGRTGSQLIARNLSSYFKPATVIHTHNPLYKPPHNDFYAVVSVRDNFDAMMSTLVAAKTNEFITYTNKEVDPFAVDPALLDDMYLYYKSFYKIIDRDLFKEVVEISYEDLTGDLFYMFSRFNINKPIANFVKKSPYKYQDLITNYNELLDYYQHLERVGISDSDVETVRRSVANELNDISTNHNKNRLGQMI